MVAVVRMVPQWSLREAIDPSRGAFTIKVRIFDPQGKNGSEEGWKAVGRSLPEQGEASPDCPLLGRRRNRIRKRKWSLVRAYV